MGSALCVGLYSKEEKEWDFLMMSLLSVNAILSMDLSSSDEGGFISNEATTRVAETSNRSRRPSLLASSAVFLSQPPCCRRRAWIEEEAEEESGRTRQLVTQAIILFGSSSLSLSLFRECPERQTTSAREFVAACWFVLLSLSFEEGYVSDRERPSVGFEPCVCGAI